MQIEQQKQAKIAGISLVIMAVIAGFTYGYAHNTLVTDTADITFRNLITNKALFLAELFGWCIIFILDLAVALALYRYFRDTLKRISLLTAITRLVYTLILGLAIVQLFRILPLISLYNPDKLQLIAIFTHIQGFEKLWSIGLIIFGLHLIGLGYLTIKSERVHWALSFLLFLGGIAYTFIHAARQLTAMASGTIDAIEKVLTVPMALAEILFAFWLIYYGFRKSLTKV